MQGGEGNFIKKDREMLPLIEINRVWAYNRAKWEPGGGGLECASSIHACFNK